MLFFVVVAAAGLAVAVGIIVLNVPLSFYSTSLLLSFTIAIELFSLLYYDSTAMILSLFLTQGLAFPLFRL